MITQEQFDEVVKNYVFLQERVENLEKEVKELKENQGWSEIDEEGHVWEE